MYCSFCGKELKKNEICTCRQNGNKTATGGIVSSQGKMKDNHKIIITIIATLLVIGVVWGIVKTVQVVEKRKAYEAIESQAMERLDEIMGENYEYETKEAETTEIESTTKTDKKATYEGVSLTDDIWDFTIAIDGIGYKLPTPFNDFKNSNWNYVYSMNNADDDEIGGESDRFVGQKNNNGEIGLCIINMSGNVKKVKDCNVGGLTYRIDKEENNCSIELAKGLKLSKESTVEDVIACWGEPTGKGANYIEYEKTTFVRYYFFVEEGTGIIKRFEMYNEIKSEDDDTATGAAPDYSDKYVAPTKLNDDFKTFTIRLQGDYYTLPAPVSEFTKNGWVIVEAEESVAAHQEYVGGITLLKDGVKISCNIKNFENYQISGTDAVVVSMIIYDYMENCDFELSGGFYIGMSEEEFLEKIDHSEFDVITYNGTNNYQDNDRSMDWHAFFDFNKEGKMDTINIGKDVF